MTHVEARELALEWRRRVWAEPTLSELDHLYAMAAEAPKPFDQVERLLEAIGREVDTLHRLGVQPQHPKAKGARTGQPGRLKRAAGFPFAAVWKTKRGDVPCEVRRQRGERVLIVMRDGRERWVHRKSIGRAGA